MDDTELLVAVRDSDPATTDEITTRLDADSDTVRRKLSELEAAGRVTREGEGEGEGWRLARDPRLDSSMDHVRKRLDSEKRR